MKIKTVKKMAIILVCLMVIALIIAMLGNSHNDKNIQDNGFNVVECQGVTATKVNYIDTGMQTLSFQRDDVEVQRLGDVHSLANTHDVIDENGGDVTPPIITAQPSGDIVDESADIVVVPTLEPQINDKENEVTDDNDVVDGVGGDMQLKIEQLVEEITPILTGLLTGLMTILALVVPYIKTVSRLKTTQGAYATVYDEHEKLLGLATKLDSTKVQAEIIDKVTAEMSNKFSKYDNALSRVLGQEEVLSAQVGSLIEGAKLAWKEADGALMVLAKTPTATALEKQSLAIEYLKTVISNELGLKRDELEKRMNEELQL